MTRRLISKCMPALALAGAILFSLPPSADATLQSAASIDGGPSLLACDNNLCAGGAVPTFLDLNPAVGTLATGPAVLGTDISVSFAVHTSIKSPGPGGLNTVSSSGTVIENTGTVAHTILFTISDTSFNGPTSQFTTTGSGTWGRPNVARRLWGLDDHDGVVERSRERPRGGVRGRHARQPGQHR
jgi:hypothetical protein